MPIVEITLLEGRSFEKKKNLVKQVTQAVTSSLDAPADSVTVILREVPPWHFAKAGEVRSEPPPAS